MKIIDNGIILKTSKIQEKLLLVKVLSSNHGICKGAVRVSDKTINSIHPACLVNFEWKARLPEHLGTIKIESVKSYLSHLLFDQSKLLSFSSLAEYIISAFKEHENCNNIYNYMLSYLDSLSNFSFNWESYIRFELEIINNAGFSLDLTECAVTRSKENLCFVSPKSGKAVSLIGAKGYEHLLLRLPRFLLIEQSTEKDSNQILDGLNLTGYFLSRYIANEYPNLYDSSYRQMLMRSLFNRNNL